MLTLLAVLRTGRAALLEVITMRPFVVSPAHVTVIVVVPMSIANPKCRVVVSPGSSRMT